MSETLAMIDERLNRIEAMIRRDNQILNIDDLAEWLDCSKSQVYKMTSKRLIPHYKKGVRVYFKRSEIEDWLLANPIMTKVEIESAVDTYCSTREYVSKPRSSKRGY